MEHYIQITRPYLAALSVNASHWKGDARLALRPEVEAWLLEFKSELVGHLSPHDIVSGRVRMDLTITLRPRRGRYPDVSNFRKHIQDVAAAALRVDDVVFYGQDNPLLISKEYKEEITVGLAFVSDDVGMPFRHTSRRQHGPLNASLKKLLGLGIDVCVGFGSAYCLTCEAGEFCPLDFSPGVYSAVPCKKCKVMECPCKGEDTDYGEREKRILAWWQARTG